MAGEALPWAPAGDGLMVVVRLTPRGGRDALEGLATLSDGRSVLKARVRAVPEDGAANTALERLLAKSLGVPPSAVAVVAGHTARVKSVQIDGDADALAAVLAAATGIGGRNA
ncbi:DUF167 family protein [Chelatococcus sp. SYSU_G07232]|uniref:UPF0235 protein QNA08_03705 n=1 Tax=Chelatococcus albus TaxID=3047466 RepID=A0ABT7AEC1_9HYPH|nr:DUF167 family protein [Chelatococcus sp. SYSU_G07232]MDJ1157342.1 DUF167 family protein [Chelatococcus sp. SYSU_G07232]